MATFLVGKVKSPSRLVGLWAVALGLVGANYASAQSATNSPTLKFAPAGTDIQDPYLAAWMNLTPNLKPPSLVPGQDYGMDASTGKFVWPKATPEVHAGVRFPDELATWDQKAYSKNVEALAFYPGMGSPSHAWVNVADFDGHRYLYIHDRDYLRVLDTTDPRHANLIYTKGAIIGPKGPSEPFDARHVQDYFGGMTISWSPSLHKPILVASYEIGRYGLMVDRTKEPDNVASFRHYNSLKGFKVYVMNGPLPAQWQLIATRTTDYKHPDAKIGEQEGSGSLDAPAFFGGRYMFLSSAPDDTYALTEYPNYLHSPGYQAWDMSDPANPKFLAQMKVPGQVIGNKADETTYLMNPRAGNRTSWMGSRMPLFLPKPVEKGGEIGFGAMGGLGVYVFDISDPKNPKILGHVNTPPSFAGTEFDNVDVSQYERTGYVFSNGYPMNKDCYEPRKDIFVIDAKDPAHPKVVATLPTPTPPTDASFTDFCQRGGNFGPKRSNAIGQPGAWRQGIVPYAYYNAGVQIFDVKNPAKPTIAGYYVPRLANADELPDYALGKGVLAIFTEYDRNIIWAFTENGAYALASPLLGAPVIGMPPKLFPERN
jgi:hypothetical protein